MFALTQEHRMVQKAVRDFAEKEILPNVEALDGGEILPFDLIKKLMKQVLAADFLAESLENRARALEAGRKPEESGRGFDPLIPSLILKELSRISPGLCMSWAVSVGLCGNNIRDRGTPDQIRRFAIPVMCGDKIGAWALTEPEAGSDAFGSMKTTAQPVDGGYVLNGSKTFITNGPHADILLCYAKVDRGGEEATRPVNAFILTRGMKGLSTGPAFKKMGMKDSPTGEVFLDNVFVPAANLLGGREKTEGRAEVRKSLGGERSGICPMCLGIVERCYELSVKYAKKRRQFGRPIAEFQAVQVKVANMYIHLQNLWNAVFRLAEMDRQKTPDPAYICASKVYAARAAVEVSLDAIQIHGGYGYMAEFHVEKLMRDAKLLEIGAGTTDINLLTTARLELGLL
ncbi:MAG: acyl-CoA dehydrogenase family protein [Thermodesulfobacteriota bacterium]